MNVAPRPRTGLALCAGVGGLELGLRLALGRGYRVVGYCEREAFSAAALVALMEEEVMDPAPVWDDLQTFPGHLWRGKVDLVAAGFPCQPWSHAGQRKGTEDDRWLWPDIRRAIREVRPGWVFLENVPGLASGDVYATLCIHCRVNSPGPRCAATPGEPGSVCDACGRNLAGRTAHLVFDSGLAAVLRDLALLGFDAEWASVSSGGLGAHHERQRIFVLGFSLGPEVADAQGEGPQDLGRQPGRGTRAGDGRGAEQHGPPVADARGDRLGEHRAGKPHGRDPGLADPEREGLQGRGASEPDGGDGDLRRAEGPARPGGRGVADPPEGGRGERDGVHHPVGRLETLASGCLPLDPPGPDQLEMWARVLEVAPSLEPALCGMVDAMAHRPNRLRAIGNGVDPVAAAVAFLALWERLHGEPVG
ncbi:MAG: DNA cytosine methyltransferase [Longimicrobiales bacterium]